MHVWMYIHRPERVKKAVLCRVDLARTRPCFHEANLCVCACTCVSVCVCVCERVCAMMTPQNTANCTNVCTYMHACTMRTRSAHRASIYVDVCERERRTEHAQGSERERERESA